MKTAIISTALTIGLILGYFTGHVSTEYEDHKVAVEAGCGTHNARTGDFMWVIPTHDAKKLSSEALKATRKATH